MRFSNIAAFAVSALLTGCAHGALVRRVTVSGGGTIIAPGAGTTIASGAAFSVNYGVSDRCHGGYSPVSFYLLAEAPTTSDVTSTGALDVTPLFHFGDYLVPNFGESYPQLFLTIWLKPRYPLGLPPMTNPPPPPATFTMPELAIGDSEVYFTVVETFLGCPVSALRL